MPASIAASARVRPVDALAEVVPARRLNAVGVVAEVDQVEIQLEDLVLGERLSMRGARRSSISFRPKERSEYSSPR